MNENQIRQILGVPENLPVDTEDLDSLWEYYVKHYISRTYKDGNDKIQGKKMRNMQSLLPSGPGQTTSEHV